MFIVYSIRKCHLHIWLNIFVIKETQDVKINCSLFVFAALNCDDMLSVSAAGLLCSGMNIPDPSDR